ncbi:GPGG-motif small membrane protein [Nocardioides pakistanensis]
MISLLLWIAAVVLVVWGVITLIQGSILMGIVLIVLGLLIGPGGVSIFKR